MLLYFRFCDDDGRVFRRDCDAVFYFWCYDGKNIVVLYKDNVDCY